LLLPQTASVTIALAQWRIQEQQKQQAPPTWASRKAKSESGRRKETSSVQIGPDDTFIVHVDINRAVSNSWFHIGASGFGKNNKQRNHFFTYLQVLSMASIAKGH
jgi:hypothetical protein